MSGVNLDFSLTPRHICGTAFCSSTIGSFRNELLCSYAEQSHTFVSSLAGLTNPPTTFRSFALSPSGSIAGLLSAVDASSRCCSSRCYSADLNAIQLRSAWPPRMTSSISESTIYSHAWPCEHACLRKTPMRAPQSPPLGATAAAAQGTSQLTRFSTSFPLVLAPQPSRSLRSGTAYNSLYVCTGRMAAAGTRIRLLGYGTDLAHLYCCRFVSRTPSGLDRGPEELDSSSECCWPSTTLIAGDYFLEIAFGPSAAVTSSPSSNTVNKPRATHSTVLIKRLVLKSLSERLQLGKAPQSSRPRVSSGTPQSRAMLGH